MNSPPSETTARSFDGWFVFALTLLILLILRWPVLSMPLYEDQSVGFGREADFLNQTNFDYLRLRYQEPHFMFGGTYRSYVVSAIPTLLATVVRLAGSVERGLFLWHLLSFLFAAGIAGLLTSLWTSQLQRSTILLLVASLMSTPMFLVQADVAGMELPLLFFSLSAGLALYHDRPVLAIFFATIAFFMKASGLLVLGAVVVMIILQQVSFGIDRRRTVAILLGGLIFPALIALLAWGDDTTLFRATFHWPSIFRLPWAIAWTPDLAILLALLILLAIGTIVHLGRHTSFYSWKHPRRPWMISIWAMLIAVGAIGSMATYIFIPRYCILPLVMLYVPLGFLLASKSLVSRLGTAIVGILLALNIINHAGSLYPSLNRFAGGDLDILTVFTTRSCAFTERSLEYLDDHRSSIAAVSLLDKLAPNATIFAEMPHWVYLASPFVGYVRSAPPDLVRADTFTHVAREFRNRLLTTPAHHDLLFLWSLKASTRMPTTSDAVEVIADDNLTPSLQVRRVRRDRLPATPVEIEEWFLDQTWDQGHLLHRAIDRYEFLKATGRLERAARELHLARWLYPNPADPEVRRAVYSLTTDIEAALAQSAMLNKTRWRLVTDASAVSTLSVDEKTNRITVANRTVPNDHLAGVTLTGPRRFCPLGQEVSIRFRSRSTRRCTLRLRLIDPFDPTRPPALEKEFQANEDWQETAINTKLSRFEPDATLVFDLGRTSASIDLESVEFDLVSPPPK
jgi:hypothetical protein